MKILLKKPAPKEPDFSKWKRKITCKKYSSDQDERCKSVLLVKFEDLTLKYYISNGVKEFYAVIQCPVCKRCTPVSKIPYDMSERLLLKCKKKAAFDGITY